MKKRFIILSLLLVSLVLTGCNKEKEETPIPKEPEVIKYYSPYTGLEVEKYILDKTPFMVMVENSPSARPQSGLQSADIVYETLAEGGIPRFMALYHSTDSPSIGPVRSVRPYFLTLSKEYSLPFAHCGGSSDALNAINRDSSIMSINEISKEHYFWREKSRKAPHNLYTSSEKLTSYINKTWDIKSGSFLSFNKNFYTKEGLMDASIINLKFNKVYSTSYSYVGESYLKSMDGTLSTDLNSGNPLEFKNLIVQKTNIKLSSDGLHLDIDLIGEGDVFVFSQGKVIEGRWKKSSETSKSTLFDLEGNEIELTPGNTIWHIAPLNSTLEY